MGAGAKADPSRIQIADLSETFEDPLARATRRMLKVMKWDRYSKVPVVYSTEKPGSVALLPLDESKVDEAEQYSALPTFRSRILPVLGTIPALFGNAMASYVVTELAGFKTEPLAVQNTKKLFDRIYRDVLTTERKHMGEGYDLPMNARDLGGVYEDVWMAKSVLSGVNVGEKLTLCRWRRDIPANSGNIVCMSRTEAAKHALIEPGQLQASYTAEIHSYVKSRFEAERKMIAWQLQYAKDCAI